MKKYKESIIALLIGSLCLIALSFIRKNREVKEELIRKTGKVVEGVIVHNSKNQTFFYSSYMIHYEFTYKFTVFRATEMHYSKLKYETVAEGDSVLVQFLEHDPANQSIIISL